MAHKIIGVLCLVLFVVKLASSIPAQDLTRSARNNLLTEDDLLDSLQADCLRKDSSACVKYKIFNFVEKNLGHKDIITVTKGVNIIKTSNSETDGASSRSFNKNATLETLLMNRMQRFLDTHTIKVDMSGSDMINTFTSTARSMKEYAFSLFEDEEDEDNLTEEGRGKKKKVKKVLKVLGPLLGLAALKGALLGKLATGALALLAGKALLTAKAALIIAVVIGVRKLLGGGGFGGFGGGGGGTVVDVVAHPHHSHEVVHSSDYGGGYGGGGHGGGYGSSGHGGWARSSEAQKLAYKAHLQTAKQ